MTTISPSVPNKGTGDQVSAAEFNAIVQAVLASAPQTAVDSANAAIALRATTTAMNDALALKADATAVGLELIQRNNLQPLQILMVNSTGSAIVGADGVNPVLATPGDYRTGTALNKELNLPAQRWWDLQKTIAYSATPTVSFTGDTPTHNLNWTMAATGDCAIKFAACPAEMVGLEGKFRITNSGGGSRAITVVDNSTTCVVELASGVSNPGLGTVAGNALTVYYEIYATDRIRIHKFDARA